MNGDDCGYTHKDLYAAPVVVEPQVVALDEGVCDAVPARQVDGHHRSVIRLRLGVTGHHAHVLVCRRSEKYKFFGLELGSTIKG